MENDALTLFFRVCECVRVRQAEARAEGSYLQTENEMVPE